MYVSPDGSGDASGTRDEPLAPEAAAAKVAAGDTVLFLPGVYHDRFSPAASGRPNAPITLRSATRHAAKMGGEGVNGVFFDINDRSYIHIEGFEFLHGAARWIGVSNSDHIEMRDLLMQGHDGVGLPFQVEQSQHVSLLDSTASGTFKWVLLYFTDSSHLRIAGNDLSLTPGRALHVENSDHVVVRGNVIHNAVGQSADFIGNEDLLMEGNILVNAVEAPDASDAASVIEGERIIFRHNRVFHNWGTPLVLVADNQDQRLVDVYLYNNVFDHTYDASSYKHGEAFYLTHGEGRVERVTVKNNILSRNGQPTQFGQFSVRNLDAGAEFTANNLWAGSDAAAMVLVDTVAMTLDDAEAQMPSSIHDNLSTPPGFAAPDAYDYRLTKDSAMVDAGAALTKTSISASGTSLAVDNCLYFFDGFDISGEPGDLIAVGDPTNRARVLAVDRADGVLTLDRELTWEAGVPVNLIWSGAAPDIGAFERGLSAGPAMRINQSAFVAQRDAPVAFEAVFRDDIEPARFEWRLGDGTVSCEPSVEHSYEDMGDYAVRLKVVDTDGGIHRGVAYVLVEGSGFNIMSDAYNERRVDSYLCDGRARPYTDHQIGRDQVGREEEGGFLCRE